ncbi:Ribosomal protein L11 methyltransferase [Candidatus Vallotia cooleyia]|nr:Ribosomal protein L11 methyltransferase [Candidatus Vallotia cooleyia]
MPNEKALFGEPSFEPDRAAWIRSRVIAMLSAEQDPAVLLEAAAKEANLSTTLIFTVHDVQEQDWVKLTQSQFKPIHIGQRIWVVPSWHEAPKQSAIVVKIDPGLAFGTGSHPTTRLCMEWIERYVCAGDSLLDYGCGSGILAILSRKCGASTVVGIDIDPKAIELAQYNSELNHVDISYGLPHECPENKFDIVIANILSNPLKLMTAMLISKVRPRGRLVLSGILVHQLDEVASAYSYHTKLSVWCEHDGWACLVGQL